MFEKILYPTDFSDEATKAFDFIKKLSGAGAKEVVFLHVIDRRGLNDLARYAKKDISFILQDLENKALTEIDPMKEELKDMGFKTKVRIEKGGPLNEILRVIEEEGASVVVTGSRGKGNLDEMLLGSVSYKLVKRTTKPILVIKR